MTSGHGGACKAPPFFVVLPSCPALCRASTFFKITSIKTWMAGTSPAMTGPSMTDASSNEPTKTPPPQTPQGELSLRTLAMPADTNQNGDIFGGWLLSQMDIGGSIFAYKIAKGRTVTVAIEAMNFRKPVYVGDLVSVHANLVKVGRTSITVHLEAWVLRRKEMQPILV